GHRRRLPHLAQVGSPCAPRSPSPRIRPEPRRRARRWWRRAPGSTRRRRRSSSSRPRATTRGRSWRRRGRRRRARASSAARGRAGAPAGAGARSGRGGGARARPGAGAVPFLADRPTDAATIEARLALLFADGYSRHPDAVAEEAAAAWPRSAVAGALAAGPDGVYPAHRWLDEEIAAAGVG